MSESESAIPAEGRMFTIEELAAALFTCHGITTGLYQVGCSLRFAGATMNWQPMGSEGFHPTAMVGIEAIGLKPVDKPGVLVFDAGQLSRAKPAAKKRASPRKVQP
ncbi:hypothetical protein [Roseateles sp. P5_E11]